MNNLQTFVAGLSLGLAVILYGGYAKDPAVALLGMIGITGLLVVSDITDR